MDKIIEHEDWQPLALEHFLLNIASRHGMNKLPSIADAKGHVFARVDEGRWLADCPQQGCGGAIVVSSAKPYFWCPYCGNDANDGQWYNVRFPSNKVAIEALLLKRSERNPWFAKSRNWHPGESIDELAKENKKRGVE